MFSDRDARHVWKKIFGLKVGDKVRVIAIYSNLPHLKSYIGREGVITDIKEDTFVDSPKNCPLERNATVYRVKLDGVTDRASVGFRVEEIEQVDKENLS